MKEKQKRRPGGGGAQPKLGRDRQEPFYQNAHSSAISQAVREPYKRIVRNCPFGTRVIVSAEPRLVTRPSVEFRTSGEALGFADALSRVEGWPVVDRREYGE